MSWRSRSTVLARMMACQHHEVAAGMTAMLQMKKIDIGSSGEHSRGERGSEHRDAGG